jgi:propionate CoA-transferase
VFCGTFTSGKLEVSIGDGKLRIERDGQEQKFVDEVEHRTFSGPYAAQSGKEVLYVTERCVFRLTQEGLELIEVAPGIDIERDILAKMAFAPIVRQPRQMDPRIFRPEPMGLRDDMLRLPFDARFKYDDEHNILYLNLPICTSRRPTSWCGSSTRSRRSWSRSATRCTAWPTTTASNSTARSRTPISIR